MFQQLDVQAVSKSIVQSAKALFYWHEIDHSTGICIYYSTGIVCIIVLAWN